MVKSGDMIICEYVKGEKAKGRVISVSGDMAKVEIVLSNRRSKNIDRITIEAHIGQLEKLWN